MTTLGALATAPRARVSRVRLAWGHVLAVLGPISLVALFVFFGPRPLSFETMIMMAVVVATALVGGLVPAVVAAVLAGLALNLFLVPPYGTLAVADPRNAAAIIVFLLTGVAVATVVDRAARTTAQAQRARAEADTLTALSRALLRAGSSPDTLLAEICQTLDLDGAALSSTRPDGSIHLDARHGVRRAESPHSSVVVAPGVNLLLHGRDLAPGDHALVSAYAAHLAVLREREQAAAESRRVAELDEATRTRTALLAAVSHDLRSPLAAVKAAASSLRSTEVSWSAHDEAELLAAIENGCDRLENLIDNLLDLSRLQMGAVNPLVTEVNLDEAVAWTLGTIPGSERIQLDIRPPLPPALVDPGLLDRVLANVIENALRHTLPPARVALQATTAADDGRPRRLLIRVVDHGHGVPTDRHQSLFVPFQRLGDVPNGDGLGLGLAVARGLTETMGGSVNAENTPGGGLTIVIDLPAADCGRS